MMNIYAIYGTGVRAKELLDFIEEWNGHISYFINSSSCEVDFYGYPVISPEEIKWDDFNFLIVSSDKYYDDIISELNSRSNEFKRYSYKLLNCDEGFNSIHSYQTDYLCAATSDGANYIYGNTDKIIGPYMRRTGKTFAEDNIDIFLICQQRKYA